MKVWQLACIIGTVLIAGIVIVVIVRLNLPLTITPQGTLDIEIAKAALTGCTVATLGAVIGAVIKARESGIQTARIKTDLLSQFMKQFGEDYHSIKAVHRRLRSFGLTNYYCTPPEALSPEQLKAYQEAILIIDDAQLSIEEYKEQFENFPLFNAIRAEANQLKTMENYLNNIKDECDREMSQFRNKTNLAVKFDDLACLSEFTAGAHNTKVPSKDNGKAKYSFKPDFSIPYHQVINSISRNINSLL